MSADAGATPPGAGHGEAPAESNRFWARWRATRARVRAEYKGSNSWLELADDLSERWLAPWYSVSFLMYLLSGVLILGGISIWLELITYGVASHQHSIGRTGAPKPNLDSVLTAIHTFYPALAWSSAMQIVLSEQSAKFLKAVALAFGSVVLVLAVIMMMVSDVILPWVSLLFGAIGIALAILLWWIANAKDQTYQDTDPQRVGLAAKGGSADPDKPMPGGTSGYDFGDAA